MNKGATTYRDYTIEPYPMDTRWYWWQHKEFDGPEDHRHGFSRSIAQAKQDIDEKIEWLEHLAARGTLSPTKTKP